MLTHMVAMRLTDPEDAPEAVQRLRAMRGHIPSLIDVRAGTNINPTEAAADVLLLTEHDDERGLADYQAHPVHQELLTWLGPRLRERVVVDSTDMA